MLYLRLPLAVVFLGFAAYEVITSFWKGQGETGNRENAKMLRPVAAVWIIAAVIQGVALVFAEKGFGALSWWCAMNLLLATNLSILPFSHKVFRPIVWSTAILACLLLLSWALPLLVPGVRAEFPVELSGVLALLFTAVTSVFAIAAMPSYLKPKAKTVEPKA